jgi:hypothetical protein
MPDAFDADASRERREQGMEDADRAAREAWKAAADAAILTTAQAVPEFTTDRIWWELDRQGYARPREPRALGPRMAVAERAGVIARTERTRRSIRASAHRNPKRIWRSLINPEETAAAVR